MDEGIAREVINKIQKLRKKVQDILYTLLQYMYMYMYMPLIKSMCTIYHIVGGEHFHGSVGKEYFAEKTFAEC